MKAAVGTGSVYCKEALLYVMKDCEQKALSESGALYNTVTHLF